MLGSDMPDPAKIWRDDFWEPTTGPPHLDCSWRKHVQKISAATPVSANEAAPPKKLWAAFWSFDRARWSQVSALLGLRPGPQHRSASCRENKLMGVWLQRPLQNSWGSNLHFVSFHHNQCYVLCLWPWAKAQFRLSLSGWTDWTTSTAVSPLLLNILSLLLQLALILPNRSRRGGSEAIAAGPSLTEKLLLFAAVSFFDCRLLPEHLEHGWKQNGPDVPSFGTIQSVSRNDNCLWAKYTETGLWLTMACTPKSKHRPHNFALRWGIMNQAILWISGCWRPKIRTPEQEVWKRLAWSRRGKNLALGNYSDRSDVKTSSLTSSKDKASTFACSIFC